ncbi:MAG: hypothetical protein IPP94_00020 [Ignavibacteria bacterium]|nr:hypothetical protein [Ignavibacteria bacterium]
MTGDSLFRLKGGLAPGTAVGMLGAGAVLGAAAQYLWLFQEQAFAFRVWGFSMIPAYLVQLPFLFALFDVDASSFARLRSVLGRPLQWLLAAGLLFAVYAGVVGLHSGSGGSLDPSWKWSTLAMSALLDLPLLLLFTLPMLLVQELFYRSAVRQLLADRPAFVQDLLSALFWTVGQGVLLWRAFVTFSPPFAASLCLIAFSTGFFASAAQRRGAVLLSGFTVVASISFAILLFGCDIPELNHVLFGHDVEAIDGLFPKSLRGRESYSFIVAASLFVSAFLLRFRKSS